jgi:hypothetical protein
MTDEHIEPMDAELSRLLKHGAPDLEAPAGAEERLLGRLSSSIPGLGPGPGPGGGGGAATSATKAAAVTAAAPVTKIVAALAAIALAGAVAVVASQRASAPHVPEPAGPVTAVVVASPSVAPSASVIVAVDVGSLPAAPSAPRASARAAPPAAPTTVSAEPASGSDVTEERRLVDGARASLARGDAAGALASIGEHERRFATGVLAEERDALAVRTLVALGRNDDARARAARFRSAHPTSLFLPGVESAVGADQRTRTNDP